MKRRQFLQRAALTGTAAVAAPYLLPGGRLFAATGNPPMAGHVVVVLFAGGIRHQEAIGQQYLRDQSLDVEGNIMYNLLPGDRPDIKIVYGTYSADGQPGGQPIAPVLQTPLATQGTLFPEMRYSTGGTGHFQGLSTAMSGYYGTTQGLQQRSVHPTIFEYLRRFGGFTATDTWFVGNGIGNSTPLLNYSAHPDFGSAYGANFFAPSVTFGPQGEAHLKGFKTFHPTEQLEPIQEMRAFLNQRFLREQGGIPNLKNTEAEKENIKAFIAQTFERKAQNAIAFPAVNDNRDLETVGYATEVLRHFTPKLTVINLNDADACHESFTGYLQNLHRADHAVGHLWNTIQTEIPAMADNTVLMVMPEHGRNLEANGILDSNDWTAYDHDSDANSRRIFSLLVGPGIDANLRVGSEDNPTGDAADLVPTIAEILGVKDAVMNAGLLQPGARSLFDYL